MSFVLGMIGYAVFGLLMDNTTGLIVSVLPVYSIFSFIIYVVVIGNPVNVKSSVNEYCTNIWIMDIYLEYKTDLKALFQTIMQKLVQLWEYYLNAWKRITKNKTGFRISYEM